jgi:hypothetical protein
MGASASTAVEAPIDSHDQSVLDGHLVARPCDAHADAVQPGVERDQVAVRLTLKNVVPPLSMSCTSIGDLPVGPVQALNEDHSHALAFGESFESPRKFRLEPQGGLSGTAWNNVDLRGRRRALLRPTPHRYPAGCSSSRTWAQCSHA